MDTNRFEKGIKINRDMLTFLTDAWNQTSMCEAEMNWRRLKLRLTKGGDFGCRRLELGGLEDSKQEAVATWA
jgi:hypothetical protein